MADKLIERLNAGVLRTRTNMIPLVDHATDTMAEAAQAIAALTADNERLRGNLQSCVDLLEPETGVLPVRIRENARAALKGDPANG